MRGYEFRSHGQTIPQISPDHVSAAGGTQTPSTLNKPPHRPNIAAEAKTLLLNSHSNVTPGEYMGEQFDHGIRAPFIVFLLTTTAVWILATLFTLWWKFRVRARPKSSRVREKLVVGGEEEDDAVAPRPAKLTNLNPN